MDDDNQFLKEWKQTRERGFWWFAVRRTAAIVGGCLLILAYLALGGDSPGAAIGGLAFAAVLIFVIAVVQTPFKWRAAEARYRDLTEKTSPHIFD